MFSRVRDINDIVRAISPYQLDKYRAFMMVNTRILFLFTLILTLFGCSTAPESIRDVEWQSHKQKLQQIESYQVIGKIGYISPQQRESMNFQWQKSPTQSQLRLTSFLGQTILNLSITEQGATVETYDNKIFTAGNGQDLINQLTGLDIPIDDLQDWVLGLPTQVDHFELNENNTLASIDKISGKQNWHVEYARYQEQPWQSENLPLPVRMQLNQDSTSIKLAISKWILNP